MPQYDYKCRKCLKSFTIEQSMLDDPLTNCPTCNGKVYRVIGKNIGIQFVGSGFYVNDNKKSKCTDCKKSTVCDTGKKSEKKPKK